MIHITGRIQATHRLSLEKTFPPYEVHSISLNCKPFAGTKPGADPFGYLATGKIFQ